ncbi:MAG: thiamine pyrophosphate-binding protein, partial [Anaerolineae bacterium]|nr:thiamine pyrophosphate-binding protein [Anaerolineae bacterium]
MNIKVSDYVADFIAAQGVTCAFEVIGGMITHLIDSIHQRGAIRLVSVHHEQAAAFAAEGFARITGVPGVALATSGPGATNLLTGIGSCYFDSTPAVFITGQVNRAELKGTRPIRQLGFQETDIVSMAAPITKKTWSVQNPDEVPAILEEAFRLALEGRPGPVLIDLPMDVQRTVIETTPPKKISLTSSTDNTLPIEDLLRDLQRAQRPLIIAGGGVRSAQAAELFRATVNKLQVPVVFSLMGTDVLPVGSPLRIGLLGSYGNRWVNLALGRSDFLLVVGSRLDIRQTGADTDAFRGERMIYHVDVDAGEINNRVMGCIPVYAHLVPFFERLLASIDEGYLPDYSAWKAEIDDLRVAWPDTHELPDISGINPNRLMHALSAHSSLAGAYVVDVGQHQMWAAQSIDVTGEQRFLTSGGMGAMGFSLPAAVGAAFALVPAPVVVVAGDGSSQLNIQELQTVARNQLPLKMIVLNNRNHGMVRQFQQSYFDERYPSTFWGYSAPDFSRVADAYGIRSMTVESEGDL